MTRYYSLGDGQETTYIYVGMYGYCAILVRKYLGVQRDAEKREVWKYNLGCEIGPGLCMLLYRWIGKGPVRNHGSSTRYLSVKRFWQPMCAHTYIQINGYIYIYNLCLPPKESIIPIVRIHEVSRTQKVSYSAIALSVSRLTITPYTPCYSLVRENKKVRVGK